MAISILILIRILFSKQSDGGQARVDTDENENADDADATLISADNL